MEAYNTGSFLSGSFHLAQWFRGSSTWITRQYFTPFCGWVTTHCRYASFCLPSIRSRWWTCGCFPPLTTMYRTTVNTCVKVLEYVLSILWGTEEWSYGSSMFNVLRNCKLLSIAAELRQLSTSRYQGFDFSISLPYSFPRAAVQNDYKLGGLIEYRFILLWFWRLEVWSQGICRTMFLLKVPGKTPSCLFQLLVAPEVPGFRQQNSNLMALKDISHQG